MQVDHPNCIKLHAIFETEKRVFIVTELVSGGELLDRCRASLLRTDCVRSVISAVSSSKTHCFVLWRMRDELH